MGSDSIFARRRDGNDPALSRYGLYSSVLGRLSDCRPVGVENSTTAPSFPVILARRKWSLTPISKWSLTPVRAHSERSRASGSVNAQSSSDDVPSHSCPRPARCVHAGESTDAGGELDCSPRGGLRAHSCATGPTGRNRREGSRPDSVGYLPS